MKLYKSHPWLRQKYIEEELTIAQIAEIIGTCADTIWVWLKKFHIPRRKRGMRFGSHCLKDIRGEKNPNWKGGRKYHSDGYVLIQKPYHPYAQASGYVPEHRLVMEEHLGRFLTPEEEVHHINGDPADNHIGNLGLFASKSEHVSFERSLRLYLDGGPPKEGK